MMGKIQVEIVDCELRHGYIAISRILATLQRTRPPGGSSDQQIGKNWEKAKDDQYPSALVRLSATCGTFSS
jgi:hypothetical protein